MAFSLFRVLKGEPLVSKIAAVAQFVVYPSVMVAYCVYVPEERLNLRTAGVGSAAGAEN